MKIFLLIGMLLAATASYADLEYSLEDELALADQALNVQAPALNIDGKYSVQEIPAPQVQPARQQKKKLTASDRMKLRRERLEERNRIMVQKKMEQIRLQQEIALAKQLEKQMNQTLKAIDAVK